MPDSMFPPPDVSGSSEHEEFGLVDLIGATADTVVLTSRVSGDAGRRFRMEADGDMEYGDGTGTYDVKVGRQEAGVWGPSTDGVYSLGSNTKKWLDGYFSGNVQTSELNVSVQTTLSHLTASRLVATSGTKTLTSVADLSVWVIGTSNQIDVTPSTGTVVLSLPSAVVMPGTLSVTGHTTPATDATYDLGSATFQWRDGRFSRDVYVGGQAIVPAGSASAPGFTFTGSLTSGLYLVSTQLAVTLGGAAFLTVSSAGVNLRSTGAVQWSSTTDPTATKDVVLVRDAANTLAQKNGTTAQEFRVYGTTTGPQYIGMAHSGTVARILASGSAGTDRVLVRNTANSNYLGLDVYDLVLRGAGIIVGTDNAFDLAASGARIRSIYWGTQALGPDGSNTAPSFSFASSTNSGLYFSSVPRMSVAGTNRYTFGAATFFIVSDTAALTMGTASDITITRDAANVLAQRNSTNAQTFRVYNTFTDVSNYEFLSIGYGNLTNVASIFVNQAGSGSARILEIGTKGSSSIRFFTNNTNCWLITSAGNITAITDNAFDIGASGATRPRTLHVGTSVVLPDGSAAAPSLTFSGATTEGIFRAASAIYGISVGNAERFRFDGSNARFTMGASYALAWSSASASSSSPDLLLVRDAANILAQRNSTTAQTFRLYETFTDASNYSRLGFLHSGSAFFIQSQAAGTGTLRALRFGVNNDSWGLSTGGHWTAGSDNAFDIGASGATRARTVYAGTSFIGPVGSVSAVTFGCGSANTGLYAPTVDSVLGFSINGTQRYSFAAGTMIMVGGATKFTMNGTAGNVDIENLGSEVNTRFSGTRTITGAVTDGYTAGLRLSPTYSAATAQTVDRHNYIDLEDVVLSGVGPAAVTDACVMRFNAAAGTHKALASGTTKTTPGTVDAWMKHNVNGTLYYVPMYTSTTS